MSDLLVPLRRCSISCGATLARWPCCPDCGSVNVHGRNKAQPYRFRTCRQGSSVNIAILLRGSNPGYRVWPIAI